MAQRAASLRTKNSLWDAVRSRSIHLGAQRALDFWVGALAGGDGFRDCARNDEVWGAGGTAWNDEVWARGCWILQLLLE